VSLQSSTASLLAALTLIAAIRAHQDPAISSQRVGDPAPLPAHVDLTVATVRGRIVAADTLQPLGGARVTARPALPPRAPAYTVTTNGVFQFPNVPPGDYSVSSRATGSYEHAWVNLTVAEMDIEVLSSRSSVGRRFAGVVTETGAAPPFPQSEARVAVIPGPGPHHAASRSVEPLGDQWSFLLSNLGGTYVFRFGALPQEWMLKAVRLNGLDITDTQFNIPAGGQEIAGLEMVITKKGGQVTGNILDREGRPTALQTVVLFPDDPKHWFYGSRFVRSAKTDLQGRFSISGLPTGSYHIAAQDYVDYEQWSDPEYLASLRRNSSQFGLGEGGAATVTIRVP
jgi:hypothetical protein